MKNSILVIGGDSRLFYAAEELIKNGFNVKRCAAEGCEGYTPEKVKEAGVLLLPVPVSNGENINAPFCKEAISLLQVAKAAGKEKMILGGKIPKGVFSGTVIDYAEREDFAVLNAVPTAEGALEIAMRETDITVAGSRVLIVGFGRIGKMLCKMFSGVGAAVCATARKPQDIALIKAFGYESAKTAEIGNIISGFDIIINTVPQMVINKECLEKSKKGALFIDTASKPGGIDMNFAEKLGIKALWALSLPGKVAPRTSGKIICDTVLNILSETGV